jgi:flagellar basal-body rod modification protein FlgD
MTTTPPIPTAAAAGGSTPVPQNPKATLGKDDFLKLMIAQLQAQNPLEPGKGTEYVGELAQFTQLEQITNLAQTSARSNTQQLLSQAVALIGHTVSCADPAGGAPLHGVVQGVEIGPSGATLTVNGTPGISPESVTEVA